MKTYLSFLITILILSLIMAIGCKKEESEKIEENEKIPVIATNEITEITQVSAVCGGVISFDGGLAIKARGVCWSTGEMPTIDNHKTEDGEGAGIFTSRIEGLEPLTKYYIRAYATNSAGTAYGAAYHFETLEAILPVLTTKPADSITASCAISGGEISHDGYAAVTARGIVWSTAESPTFEDNDGLTDDGEGTGSFTSFLTELTPVTTYYVKAYAISTAGISYGNQLFFTTEAGDPPIVNTATVTNISTTTATGGGDVVAQGDTPVTQKGVCWRTSPNPTIEDNFTNDGSDIGPFTSELTGLNLATTYFVRAYAINAAGTVYGDQEVFTTDTPPTVTTAHITNISVTTASGGGSITSQGSAPVSQKGVCWSTSPNPTISNNTTNDGSGTEAFESQLSGLHPATTYYVRAYATNAAGTAYGNQVTFKTGTAVVEVYNPATGRTWMDRNMGASRVALTSTDSQAYGDLYQWGRLTDGHQIRNSGTTSNLSYNDVPGHSNYIVTALFDPPNDWRSPQNNNLWQGTNGINNPCPEGFRLPTEAEWNTEIQSWSSIDAAGAFSSVLKLPVTGYRNRTDGSLRNVGFRGYYWSSTANDTGSMSLRITDDNANLSSNWRAYGDSVRCIKD